MKKARKKSDKESKVRLVAPSDKKQVEKVTKVKKEKVKVEKKGDVAQPASAAQEATGETEGAVQSV